MFETTNQLWVQIEDLGDHIILSRFLGLTWTNHPIFRSEKYDTYTLVEQPTAKETKLLK
jgi:hypothetical protein